MEYNLTMQEIIDTLASGLCKFTFTKKDGTVHNAYGTLNLDMLGPNITVPSYKGTTTVPYYDLEVNAWRSFKTESFVKFLNVMKLNPNIEITIY